MSTKTLAVCGASSDIGMALLARVLNDPDTRVIAHAHKSAGRLSQLSASHPERCLVVEADLSTADGCASLVARAAEAAWQPTHFVHLSALPLIYERFEKFDWARFTKDLELQVGSITRLLPAWLPRPRRNGELRDVVVVSSSVTLAVPPKYVSMYTAVKYAQLGLLKSLTTEYAERGVVVNSVSPSMVDTRFLEQIPSTAREMSATQNPLGRNATADEVAEVVELLLARHRPFLSGANIPLGAGVLF